MRDVEGAATPFTVASAALLLLDHHSRPAGTQPSDRLLMRGRGVPRLNGGSPGDQYVSLRVEVPKTLTPRQEASMKEFALDEAPATGSTTGGAGGSGFIREAIERIRKAMHKTGADSGSGSGGGGSSSSSGSSGGSKPQ